MFGTKQITEIQFKEINASGVFIAQIKANHEDSMFILRQKGLRPLIYQEALVKIDQNSELLEKLNGKWFYLDGKGLQLSGYYTFNDDGELTQKTKDTERTVRVWAGEQPLSLYVHADHYVKSKGHYDIDAFANPSTIMLAVVGVKIGHEVVTPKIEVSRAEQPEIVTFTGISLDAFKAIRRRAELELAKLTETTGPENLLNIRKLMEVLRIKE